MQPLWKTIWSILKKFKIELPFDPEIPLLGIYPKEPEIPIQKIYICTPMFVAALCTTAEIWKQPKYPVVRQVDKKAVVQHICTKNTMQ